MFCRGIFKVFFFTIMIIIAITVITGLLSPGLFILAIFIVYNIIKKVVKKNKNRPQHEYTTVTNDQKNQTANDQKSLTRLKSNYKSYDASLSQALKIKSEIEKKIKKAPQLNQKFDKDDISQLLEHHINTLKQLILRSKELEEIINHTSIDQINKKIIGLKKKQRQINEERLIEEYQKTIQQYEQHIESYYRLLEQRELIHLKIDSAVLSLKQLKMDQTRMNEIITGEQDLALKEFEKKTSDLSNYVDHLDQSYKDLNREL